MRVSVPAVASSPIPAVLENLGPLDEGRGADLRVHLGAVPDPRSWRGQWYPLTAILLMCACAAVSGARSIEEVAEFGQRACRSVLAALGVRRHLLGWRRPPSAATIGRVLAALDGDALNGRSAPTSPVSIGPPSPRRPALRIGSSPWTAGPSRNPQHPDQSRSLKPPCAHSGADGPTGRRGQHQGVPSTFPGHAWRVR
ncbi:transposase family protein [Streptomyces sp. KM273126]|uniref:transposase family protein n=1 Tax=Streptomyces sp. KM273126 TaxID=2545247 RepID=UPI00215D69D0|nr:transposase family protein [Streptomyces sp. KM273126]